MPTDDALAAEADSANILIPYQPLETPRSVRFLRARRRGVDGAITVSLRHFSLDNRTCPQFTAFSYVWGERKPHPEPVFVDGRACRVLDSIHPILTLICDHAVLNTETWFWIDYLCINQADDRERGEQVALMGRLYELAHRTVVWLGPATPDVAGAAATMITIAAWPAPSRARGGDGGGAVGPERASPLCDTVAPQHWRAMSRWMARPWWTRVWTLQEFLLPARLVFHCGGESVTKQTWFEAVGAIYDHQGIARLGTHAFGIQRARRRLLEYYEDERTRGKMGLVAMMAYVGHYEATDERDRIYALLGVCTDLDRHIVGQPDYGTRVDGVYTRLATRFIEVHRSLDIICFGALLRGPQRLSDDEKPLPSWIPDWRRWKGQASRPVPSMVSEPSRSHIGNFRPVGFDGNAELRYTASGDRPAVCVISEDQRRLTCKGIVIDRLDGLGPAHHSPREAGLHLIQTTSAVNVKPRKISSGLDRIVNCAVSDAVLESLVRCLSLDRSGRYLTSAARTGAYVNEFQDMLDHSPEGCGLSWPPAAVAEWFAANAELAVRGASLMEHVRAATPAPERAGTPGKHTLWRAAESTVGEWPRDCRLVVTEQGQLGMAPGAARKGDVVFVLVGCSVPVVLRRSDGDEAYVVVGECFLPGFMKGEAFADGAQAKEIVLV